MATKKSSIKLLFFSPYFYPYISGLTQYPYRLFTESKLPLDVTCLSFMHRADLANSENLNPMSLRTLSLPKGKQSHILNEIAASPVAPRNDIFTPTLIIKRMPFAFRLSKGFISPQSLVTFWKAVKENEVVMLNLPSVEGLALALFARLQRKPIISLLHCEVLLPFSPLNLLINAVLNFGVFIQLFLSQKIIIYTKDYYEKKWMYSFFKNKMEVILPPVHTDLPDKEYLETLISQRKKYSHAVGFCGRIAAEKGIEILIKSILEIKSTILFIAGPTGKDVVGEERYFEKIEKMLSENNIPHVFLGTLSGPKLSSFYRVVDVLILPSLNKTEAFGMVQVEAMLQGTPVVASNLPGVRMPIHMTKMGMVTKPGNADELKQALLTVFNKRANYTNPQLIHNVKLLFDSQKTYGNIYRAIQSVL